MICDKCGYSNQDFVNECSSCGAELEAHDAISDEEMEKLPEKLVNEGEPLIASKLDKVMKWVCFALAPMVFITFIIFEMEIFISLFLATLLIWGGIMAGHPVVVWEFEKMRLNITVSEENITPTETWAFGRKLTIGC